MENINNQPLKKKNRYYRQILLDEIDKKIKHLRNLKLQLVINNEKYEILTYGLNHGIAVLKKQNIVASNEALWDQLKRNKYLKENFRSIQRAENGICAMSFSLLDMSSKQLAKDKSKINILNNLLKDVVLLKPDKSNGIVLVNCLSYKNWVRQMFSDRTKFHKIHENPTFRELNALQEYLRKLKERKEISEEIY